MAAGPFLDHRLVRARLENVLASGELPPAFLFTGAHGVGKEEAALELAMALNCPARRASALPDLFAAPAAEGEGTAETPPARLGGCRTCSACDRIARYAHPDVIVRLPLPRPRGRPNEPADPGEALVWKAAHPYRDPVIEGGNPAIGIADVREVIRQLARAPVEAERRVIIFREVEAMTEEAQNALLKSLEEPPAHTIFILTTDRPRQLLPTVRSRCRTVSFGPLPAAVIAAYLEQRDIGGAFEHLPVLARGSLKRALAITGGEIPGREEALQMLEWAAAGERVKALQWAAEYTFRSGQGAQVKAREMLSELLSLLRDVAVLQSGGEELQNPDAAVLLRRLAGTTPPERTARTLTAALEAAGEVDSFVNLALIYAGLYETISPV